MWRQKLTELSDPAACRKSINRSGPGFGYGFLVAFCFTLAFFVLLVGLVMDGFRGQVDTLKTSEYMQLLGIDQLLVWPFFKGDFWVCVYRWAVGGG